MSLLWPNQVYLSLSAHGFAMLSCDGITKRHIIKQQQQYQANVEWATMFADLDSALSKVQKNAQLTVTLMADFVRYLVLPPQVSLVNVSDKQSYAKAVYLQVYGAVADDWVIQIDDVPLDSYCLTCAIDKTLFETMKSLASKHKLTLRSLQPYLMASYNQLSVRDMSGYLVIVEPSRLLLMKHDKDYHQLKSIHWTNDWQQVLHQHLLREALLDEKPEKNVFIYAPMAKKETFLPLKDWQLKRVGRAVNNTLLEPEYAMLEVFL